MKLSENTVEILKNFASINMNLLLNPGNTLRTCSTTKNFFAEAVIDEKFDKQIGIYDLNKFLALLSMKSGDPDVEVEDKSFAFKGLNKGKIRMRFSEPSILIAPSDKLPDVEYEVQFTINHDTLKWINNVASILKAPHILIESDGDGDITMSAGDATGAMTDDAKITLEGESKHQFVAVFDLTNLNFIPGTYGVELSSMGLIKVKNKNRKLTYWVAMSAEDNKKIVKSIFANQPMRKKRK